MSSKAVIYIMKEHCLMGIKGTVRRSTDGHIIHANIDTDVIIAEEPPYGTAVILQCWLVFLCIISIFCFGKCGITIQYE